MVVELKIPITLGEVAFCCSKEVVDMYLYREKGAEVADPVYKKKTGDARVIRRVVTDSREARAGDLFVALRGKGGDGNEHLGEASARGAYTLSDTRGDADIFVKEVYSALGNIAALYKSLASSLKKTVCITGSVGKTTTKNFTTTMLSGHGRVCATKGNENNLLGVPLTVLSLRPDTEYLVIEAGMNHFGELSHISKTVCPDVAMITRIGTAHIGNFGDRKKIATAKLELFSHTSEGASLLIPYGEPLLSGRGPFSTVAVGYEPSADFSIAGGINGGGLSGEFYKGGDRILSFSTEITARQLLPSLGFALAACYCAGIDPTEISALARRLSDTDTRIKVHRAGNVTVIDDAYNASRESVMGALDYLTGFGEAPKCALLGDILELGALAEDIHYEIGKYAARMLDMLFVCGDNREHLVRGALAGGLSRERIMAIDGKCPEEIAREVATRLSSGILLIKGSHETGLYLVGEHLSRNGG